MSLSKCVGNRGQVVRVASKIQDGPPRELPGSLGGLHSSTAGGTAWETEVLHATGHGRKKKVPK